MGYLLVMPKKTKRPEVAIPEPTSLQKAMLYFADEGRALEYVASRRWPNGVTCPTCGRSDVTYLASQRRWKCKGKHKKAQFSAKVGTVFEDSPIPFSKWLPAMWMLANCKNGISSYELADALSVTQKTAWFMLQRLRLAMQQSGGKLGSGGGLVQVDETWIGADARKMSRSRRKATRTKHTSGPHAYSGKAIVLGMLEKGGRVAAMVVPDTKRRTLLPQVVKHVARGAEIHTDELTSYQGLVHPYVHKVVNHSVAYVQDGVHTNNMENFWSLLKRTIRGTYVSVEPFHLHRYLDEQAYRFNRRKGTSAGRFDGALGSVVGKRLTYQGLIGQPAS
jgi:transposase-like protein